MPTLLLLLIVMTGLLDFSLLDFWTSVFWTSGLQSSGLLDFSLLDFWTSVFWTSGLLDFSLLDFWTSVFWTSNNFLDFQIPYIIYHPVDAVRGLAVGVRRLVAGTRPATTQIPLSNPSLFDLGQ
jgi:hypothetical protein